jgi:hypothetical protein
MTSPAKTTAAQAISLARLARLVILILKTHHATTRNSYS